MTTIRNRLGTEGKDVLQGSARISSPGGSTVTPDEWAAVHEAVERDLQAAAQVPPGSPLAQGIGDRAEHLRNMAVSINTEVAAATILEGLKAIGPHTDQIVSGWIQGKRELTGADHEIAKLLATLDKALTNAKNALVESARRTFPSDEGAQTAAAKVAASMELAATAAGFELGDPGKPKVD